MKSIVILLLLISAVCGAQTVPGDYPEASTKSLTEADIEELNGDELIIMRNEIFARYGHIFKKPELREHFSAQDWYKPRFADVTSKLSELEKRNAKFILAWEEQIRPVPLRKLPRLRLPISPIESLTSTVQNVIGISPRSKDGNYPARYIGTLLADTTRYYAVLWVAAAKLIYPEGSMTLPIYYITTYTKALKEIATAAVTYPLGMPKPGGTDCDNSNYTHTSIIALNLSYSSLIHFQEKCPGENARMASWGVAGRINSDGTIQVDRAD